MARDDDASSEASSARTHDHTGCGQKDARLFQLDLSFPIYHDTIKMDERREQ